MNDFEKGFLEELEKISQVAQDEEEEAVQKKPGIGKALGKTLLQSVGSVLPTSKPTMPWMRRGPSQNI